MSEIRDRLYGGVYSYIMTPFNGNGDIDHGALEEYVERLIDSGVDGVTINASTTEALYLTDIERKSVVETVCRKVAGRVVVNVGAGALSTHQSLYFGAHAKDQGADRLIVDVPTYFPVVFEDVYRHFCTLGEQIELPIRVYNISAPTKFDFLPAQVLKMSQIPMVDSFKEATGDPHRSREVIGLCGDKIQVFCGFHWMLPIVIGYGAVGWEGGMHPLFSGQCIQLYRSIMRDAGSSEAKDQFEALKPLFFFLKTFGVTQTIKAMDAFSDLKLGALRKPLPSLPAEMLVELKSIIDKLEVS